MDQVRIDDLKTLLVKYPEQVGLSLTYHADEHIYELDLSTLTHTYYHFVRGFVNATDGDCIYRASLIPIQHSDINNALKDPFNKSTIDEILYNFGRSSDGASSSIYLYPDVSMTLGTIFVEYIKKPRKINLGGYTYIDGTNPTASQCEFPEHVHPQIVDEAVKLASGIMNNPQLYQVMQNAQMSE